VIGHERAESLQAAKENVQNKIRCRLRWKETIAGPRVPKVCLDQQSSGVCEGMFIRGFRVREKGLCVRTGVAQGRGCLFWLASAEVNAFVSCRLLPIAKLMADSKS